MYNVYLNTLNADTFDGKVARFRDRTKQTTFLNECAKNQESRVDYMLRLASVRFKINGYNNITIGSNTISYTIPGKNNLVLTVTLTAGSYTLASLITHLNAVHASAIASRAGLVAGQDSIIFSANTNIITLTSGTGIGSATPSPLVINKAYTTFDFSILGFASGLHYGTAAKSVIVGFASNTPIDELNIFSIRLTSKFDKLNINSRAITTSVSNGVGIGTFIVLVDKKQVDENGYVCINIPYTDDNIKIAKNFFDDLTVEVVNPNTGGVIDMNSGVELVLNISAICDK